MEKKRAIITGGTKGIGRALCHKFASEGFDIITCARNVDDLEALRQSLAAKYAVGCLALPTDVAQKNAVEAFARQALAQGSPDVLINNVGLFNMYEFVDEPEGNFEQMLATNVGGPYHLTRQLLPTFIKQKSGHIFNICSVASVGARKAGGSYFLSKYALLGFSRGLREDLKEHGIRVTAILPSATLTASWDGADIAPDRLIAPEDVAGMAWAAYQMAGNSVVEELLIRPQLGDY